MTKCYHSSCPNHSKDQPFCLELECTASEEEIDKYEKIRKAWIESNAKTFARSIN